MSDDVMTRLEQRIAKLEVANRRWRRLAGCAMIGLAGLGVMGAQRSKDMKVDQIEAQRITIRDAAGAEMITLGKIDKKNPGMRLTYPGSRSSASFFTSDDHATLALMDNTGSSSITLNSGGASSAPDISMVKVGPGAQVKRLFRAP